LFTVRGVSPVRAADGDRELTKARAAPTPRWWILALALAVSAGVGLTVAISLATALGTPSTEPGDRADLGNRALLEPGSSTTTIGDNTAITTGLRSFAQTVRIDEQDVGLTLDPIDVECHGGMARIEWHVGNLEPTAPQTGIHLAAQLDGEVVASLLRGSTMGIWNDVPVSMVAVLPCPSGRHLVDLLVAHVTGQWGVPYVVNTDDEPSGILRVNRGFVVTEVWASDLIR
jgi:hypothetical protein